MTRSRDIADQQENLGGAVAPVVTGKNAVINGGMDFFQRGSFSTTSGGYGLDRWYQVSSGSGSNVTITQQTTGVPLGSRYCARITTGASAGYGNQFHYIETSNVVQFWGKTATISIKLRRSSTFGGTLAVIVGKSATVDAGGGASWTNLTASGVNVATNAALPTGTTSSDWLTISYQVDVPNDGTANSLRISIQQNQVETSAYWEMAQCQLEVGSQSTPFSRSGGSIGGELALCQRYYCELGNALFGSSDNSSTTIQVTTPYPVTMRAIPSISVISGRSCVVRHQSGDYTSASPGLAATSVQINALWTLVTGFTSLTLNGVVNSRNSNGSLSFIAASAEL